MSGEIKLVGREAILDGVNLTASADYDFEAPRGAIGFRVFMETVHNGGGTPTLDCDIQAISPGGTAYTIVSETQVTTSDNDEVTLVYPGSANDDCASAKMRASFTLGGSSPDYTVGLYIEWLG